MSREPLAREGLISAVAALVAQGLVVWGLPLTPEQTAWLQAAVMLAAVAWTVLRARPQVTPISDPRGIDGQPLVFAAGTVGDPTDPSFISRKD